MQSSNNKRIAKNTFMLYIRMVILMLVNFYTSRVVLNTLGVDDYGLYSIVGAIVIFLGFINISMSAASQRFLSFYQGKGDMEALSSTFNSIFVVQLIIGLVILLIGESLGVIYIEKYLNVKPEKIASAHIVFQFSLLSFVSKTITVPYFAAIIANERMNVFALISIVEALLQLSAAMVLKVIPEHRLVSYSIMMFIAVFTVQLCYRIYASHHFQECRIKRNWNTKTIREIFAYSGWNLLGALSSVGIDQGINMVLNSFFGVVVNAARGIAFQVSTAIASLSANFQQALNPQIVKTYADGAMEKMHTLIMNGTRFCYFLLLILSAPVLFNMHPLLEIWLKDVPEYTTVFCRLILINALISSLSGSLLMGALATGKIRNYQITVATINLLNIPAAIVGLHIWPNPYLTAYIMISLSVIAFSARLYITSRLNGLPIRIFILKSLLPIIMVSVFVALWSIFIDAFLVGECFVMLATRIICMFTGSVFIISTLGISRDEKRKLIGFVANKIKK